MTRIEYIKYDKWRILLGIFLTILIPFSTDWYNPAGAQPTTIISGLALLFWFGFIITMCVSDKLREELI